MILTKFKAGTPITVQNNTIQVFKEDTLCYVISYESLKVSELFGTIPIITDKNILISFHSHKLKDPRYISFNNPIIHNGELLPKNASILLLDVRSNISIPMLIKMGRDIVDIFGKPIIHAFKDGSIRISKSIIIKYEGLMKKHDRWKYPGSIITALIPNQYSDLDIIIVNKLPPRTNNPNIKLVKCPVINNVLTNLCNDYASQLGMYPEVRYSSNIIGIDYINTIIEIEGYRMNLLQYVILDKELISIDTNDERLRKQFNTAFNSLTRGMEDDVYDLSTLYLKMYYQSKIVDRFGLIKRCAQSLQDNIEMYYPSKKINHKDFMQLVNLITPNDLVRDVCIYAVLHKLVKFD